MITNERQYRITQAEAARFREALHEAIEDETSLSSRMHQAMLDGMRSQLRDLERELEEYEALKSGRIRTVSLDSLSDLPRILIMGRIAANLTQAELAHRLGVHEQQVQRDESSMYGSASLDRLIEIADALGLRIRGTATMPIPHAVAVGNER